jgi:DNA-binding HxlR family transcriptional regulator
MVEENHQAADLPRPQSLRSSVPADGGLLAVQGRGQCQKTVNYRDGPGAGITPVVDAKRNRRPSDPTVLDRGRPSSVAQTLKVIGDRWSFMVIREAFFGIRRFDDLQNTLGIAPNILTDRLDRLVAEGIFKRRKYRTSQSATNIRSPIRARTSTVR